MIFLLQTQFNEVFLDLMKKMEMDLIWFERVPYYNDYNDADWHRAMESLVVADPRVIVYNGDAGFAPLCWFYRYNLYGPNYVIFIIQWADSNTDQIYIPDYVKDWCTVDMVRITMNSTFIYGETNKADLFPDEPDDFGLTRATLEHEVTTRVEDPENILWFHNRYSFYDAILFGGLVLNEVERNLKEQNDSLINWSVGSEKFKQNGAQMVDLMKNAIMSIKLNGLRGNYEFYKNTTLNSGGFTPIPVFQVVTFPGSNIRKRIELHDGHQIIEKPHWKTPDGAPPYDKVHIKRVQVQNLKSEATAALIVLSAIVSISTMGVIIFKKEKRSLENCCFAFGVIVANCHVYLFPFRNLEPIARHCSVMGGLLLIGLSTCFLAIRELLVNQFEICAKRLAEQSANDYNRFKGYAAKAKRITIMLFWQISIILLGILFVFSSPIDSVGSEATIDITFGKRQVELSTQTKCQLNGNIFSMVVVGLTLAIVIVIILQSFFLTYRTNVVIKKTTTMEGMRRSASSRKSLNKDDKRKQKKHGGVFLTVMVPLIIGAGLLIVIMVDQALYISAAVAIIFGVILLVKLLIKE